MIGSPRHQLADTRLLPLKGRVNVCHRDHRELSLAFFPNLLKHGIAILTFRDVSWSIRTLIGNLRGANTAVSHE